MVQEGIARWPLHHYQGNDWVFGFLMSTFVLQQLAQYLIDVVRDYGLLGHWNSGRGVIRDVDYNACKCIDYRSTVWIKKAYIFRSLRLRDYGVASSHCEICEGESEESKFNLPTQSLDAMMYCFHSLMYILAMSSMA